MLKPLLIRTMLIYVVSAIALAIWFTMAGTIGTTIGKVTLWAVTWRLFLVAFIWGLCWAWALIRTALYLVYEFIVKRSTVPSAM